MFEYYKQGMGNKVMAAHNLNASSSRSHTVFTITIECINKHDLKEVSISKL